MNYGKKPSKKIESSKPLIVLLVDKSKGMKIHVENAIGDFLGMEKKNIGT